MTDEFWGKGGDEVEEGRDESSNMWTRVRVCRKGTARKGIRVG